MDIIKRSLSPISPFQFESFIGELSSPNSSSVISSTEGRSVDSDNDNISPSISTTSNNNPSIAHLIDIQGRLHNCLKKSQELNQTVDRVSHKLGTAINTLPSFVAPLHCKSTGLSKELNGRIDRGTASALTLLRVFKSVYAVQTAIGLGPGSDVGQYVAYITYFQDSLAFLRENCPKVVQRLQEAVEFLGRCRAMDNFHVRRLNEILVALRTLQDAEEYTSLDGGLLDEAMEHLETEFRRILTVYGVPMSLPVLYPAPQDNELKITAASLPLPAPVIQILQEIVNKLAANGRLKNCLEIYEDVRSWKAGESLQVLRPDYLRFTMPEAIDKLDWSALEEYIAKWIQQIQVFVNMLLASERNLCQQIFSAVNNNLWAKCFGMVALKAGLERFLQFGDAVARSQTEPQKLFKMLDMFQTLENLGPSLEQVLSGDACRDVREQVRELQKKIVQGACGVFWEFGLQVEVQREGISPSDGGVLKLAKYVVNYIKYLVSNSYKSIIDQVLTIAQSWRGGCVEYSELTLSILHIMESLERTVEARSKMFKDPALSCLFTMNNYWYIYTRSKNSELGSLLGEGWLKHHKVKTQQCAMEYQKAAWGAVLDSFKKESGMRSSGSLRGNSTREIIRYSVKAFQTAFDDIYQKHYRWCIPENDLRQYVGISVLQTVVPAYRSYLHNFGFVIQQGTPMHFKYSPEELEQMLTVLFQEKMARKSRHSHHASSNNSILGLDYSM